MLRSGWLSAGRRDPLLPRGAHQETCQQTHTEGRGFWWIKQDCSTWEIRGCDGLPSFRGAIGRFAEKSDRFETAAWREVRSQWCPRCHWQFALIPFHSSRECSPTRWYNFIASQIYYFSAFSLGSMRDGIRVHCDPGGYRDPLLKQLITWHLHPKGSTSGDTGLDIGTGITFRSAI